VTLSAGTVSVATIANGGVASNLGAASSAASKLVFDGGALQYTGAGSTSDRAFTINTGKTATIEVTNVAANLTLAGGTAASTGSLAKTGPGTLTLTGAQAFSGGATVDGGKLAIGNGGSGASLGSAVVLSNNANLTFNQSDDTTLTKVTSGNGSLTKDGTGKLTISTAQTYDGATVVAAGTLSLSGVAPPSAVTWDFETGDLTGWHDVGTTYGPDDLYKDGNEPVSNSRLPKVGTYYIDGYAANNGGSDGHTGILESDSFVLGESCQIDLLVGGGGFSWSGTPAAPAGSMAGVALERETSPGVWENVFWESGAGNNMTRRNWDASAYAGQKARLRVYDTNTGGWGWTAVDDIHASAASLGLTGGAAVNVLPTTTALAIASGAVLDLSGGTQQVVSLANSGSGGGSLTNSGSSDATLTIIGTGTATFGGVISDGATNKFALVKDGAGTQVLSGTNTYTGDTTVTGGTLKVQGSLASAQTTVTGTLGGNGTISGTVTLSVGGSLGAKISDWGGAAGSGFEDLAVGALDIAAGSHTISLDTTGMSGFSESNKIFRILTTGTGITGFSAGDFSVVATGFSGTGTWAVQETSGALEIVYTASGGMSPYDTWASGSFANAFTQTGLDQDQDMDGHKNVMEYGFDTDPTVSSSSSLAYSSNGTTGTVSAHGQPILVKEGGVYYAVYGRRKDHPAGLTYTVQFSAEMNPGQWVNSTDAPSEPFASDATMEVVKVPYPSGLIQSAPGQFRKARFFRVEVTQQ
jgi:fibronectin-binding autotransporter adhesin